MVGSPGPMLPSPPPLPLKAQPITEEISILIVDDIKMNRMMLKRRFQKAIAVNCVVAEAASGEEALAMLAASGGGRDNDSSSTSNNDTESMHSNSNSLGCGGVSARNAMLYDIILVDQYMEESGGVMLGTDTVYAMRRMQVSSFIIGCSGNDMGPQFKQAGADAFWGKPLPPNEEIIQSFRSRLFEDPLSELR